MKALVITVVATIVVVTFGMVLYMSFMSADRNGWRELARRYRLRGRFEGTAYHFRTAVMNGFAFHGILVLGVGDSGLMLKPFWLLRAFHHTLLLPWDQLRATRFERTHHKGYRVTWKDGSETDGTTKDDEDRPPLVLEWSDATQRLMDDYLPAD